jgi:hypothetical protein
LEFFFAAARQGSLASPVPLVSSIKAQGFAMMAMMICSSIVGGEDRSERDERSI